MLPFSARSDNGTALPQRKVDPEPVWRLSDRHGFSVQTDGNPGKEVQLELESWRYVRLWRGGGFGSLCRPQNRPGHRSPAGIGRAVGTGQPRQILDYGITWNGWKINRVEVFVARGR